MHCYWSSSTGNCVGPPLHLLRPYVTPAKSTYRRPLCFHPRLPTAQAYIITPVWPPDGRSPRQKGADLAMQEEATCPRPATPGNAPAAGATGEPIPPEGAQPDEGVSDGPGGRVRILRSAEGRGRNGWFTAREASVGSNRREAPEGEAAGVQLRVYSRRPAVVAPIYLSLSVGDAARLAQALMMAVESANRLP